MRTIINSNTTWRTTVGQLDVGQVFRHHGLSDVYLVVESVGRIMVPSDMVVVVNLTHNLVELHHPASSAIVLDVDAAPEFSDALAPEASCD